MNKDDLENTPDYQEWRLSYVTLKDIDARIKSLQSARIKQHEFYNECKEKVVETCSANGHFYGKDVIKKVNDGQEKIEEAGCTDDSGDYHEGEVTYIDKYKHVAIKTCSLCHHQNERNAIKTESYS